MYVCMYSLWFCSVREEIEFLLSASSSWTSGPSVLELHALLSAAFSSNACCFFIERGESFFEGGTGEENDYFEGETLVAIRQLVF